MELYFESSPGGAMLLSMIKYLQSVIMEFLDVLKFTKTCLSGDHIFNVHDDYDREILNKEVANKFHHAVAQLLYLCK